MPQDPLPLILEPEALEAALGRENLVIVDLGDLSSFEAAHVPGAVHMDYATLVAPRPPVLGRLPGDAELATALGSVGITPESHVVAYDDQGNGRACRLLWTLDVVGHPGGASLLNGGLAAWENESHPTDDGDSEPRPAAYAIRGRTDAAVDKDYVLARLEDPGVVILDARSEAEYAGADCRAARAGHIPGAVNLDWSEAIDRERNLRLKPEAALRDLYARAGVTPDKEVITHCHTHHRSAHTYVVLKSLGYERVRGYPGSWSEWGNDPRLPVEM